MLAIVLIMLLALVISGAVVVYVAYPHRNEDLPLVPKLGTAMRKGVDSLPTLGDNEDIRA